MLHVRSNLIESDNLLLCLHGNSADSAYFNPLLESVIDWHVVAPDLIGHGHSPRLQPHEYTVDYILASISEMLNGFEFKRLAVIGHSLGGHLALQMSEKLKDSALLLMASPPVVYAANMLPDDLLPNFEINDSKESVRDLSDYLQKFSPYEIAHKHYLSSYIATDPMFRIEIMKEFEKGAFKDEREIIKQGHFRSVSYMSGLQDFVVSKVYEDWLKVNLAFDAWIELQEAGHFPLIEDESNSVAEVKRWLQNYSRT